MFADTVQADVVARGRVHRADGSRLGVPLPALKIKTWAPCLLAVMAIGFVIVGAGNQDLGWDDARLGLAAGEPFGPIGQVFGSYAPELWPARVAVCRAASLVQEGGRVTAAAVLWPSALAAVAIGWLLSRRLGQTLGTRTGLWFGLCWLSCVGVVDHSGGTGLDFLSGLAVVAAIDRLLTRGSDFAAGLWTTLAMVAGGWPPVVLVLLTVMVLGRPETWYSARLLVPPFVGLVGWSIWTLATATPEAWTAALAWPFAQRPDWTLPLWLLGLGLPFGWFALLAASRPLREQFDGPGRSLLTGWTQAAIACLIAGTIVPGLSLAARVPALAGLMVAAAPGVEAAWSGTLTRRGRLAFLAITFGLSLVWLMVLVYGGFVWLLRFPYYRPMGIVAVCLGAPLLVLAWLGVEQGNTRRASIALVLLAVSLKLVHWGYYVPESNYRHGQGPWGRAIGQWVLPNWTIHTIHDWPPDLCFAINRPIRRLRSPQHLAYPANGESRHVLLLESEFENWPSAAPRLLKIATFHDAHGDLRILARTPGELLTPSGTIYSQGPNP